MPYTKQRREKPLEQLNIKEYLENRKAHDKATMIVKSTGEKICIYEGIEYAAADFDKKFPLAITRHNPKGKNPDTRYIYFT